MLNMKPYHCFKQLPSRNIAKYFLDVHRPVPFLHCYSTLTPKRLQQAFVSSWNQSHSVEETEQNNFFGAGNSKAFYRKRNDRPALDRFADPHNPHSNVNADPTVREQQMDHKLFVLDNDIRRFGRIDPLVLDSYLSLLRPEDEISSPVALTLLKCCGNNMPMYPTDKKIAVLHKIWDTLKEHKFQFDISHFNSLLLLYLESNFSFSPVEILARLEKEGIEPNRVTFQRLIRKFAISGDLPGAGAILEHMKSLDMPLTEYVCNSLLFANIKAKQDAELKSVLAFMETNGMDLTAESYADMMCAYAGNQDIENVEKILNEQSEIPFSDCCLLDVAFEFIKNKRPEHAKRIIARVLKTPGYVHEALNLSLRVNALGDYEQAMEILETVVRPSARVGETLDFGGAILLQAIDLNFSEDKILHLCEIMVKTEINRHALESVYVIAAERAKKELATSLMKALIDKGEKVVELRAQCFWPLLLMNARDHDIVGLSSVVALMRRNEFTVDLHALETWIWPYLAPGKSNMELLDLVKVRMPDLHFSRAVTALLLYRIASGELKEAREIVKVYPDHLTLDHYTLAKLTNCLRLNQLDIDFITEMFQNVIQAQPSRNMQFLSAVDQFLTLAAVGLNGTQPADVVNAFVEKKIAASPDLIRRAGRMLAFQDEELQEKLKQMMDFGFSLSSGQHKDHKQFELVQQADLDEMSESDLTCYVQMASNDCLKMHLFALVRSKKTADILKLYSAMEAHNRGARSGVLISMCRGFLACGDLDNALKFFELCLQRKHRNFMLRVSDLMSLFTALASAKRWEDLRLASEELAALDSAADVGDGVTSPTAASQQHRSDGTSGGGADQLPFADPLAGYQLESLLQKLFARFTTASSTATTSGPQLPSLTASDETMTLAIFENIVKYKPFGVSTNHLSYITTILIKNNHMGLTKRLFEILFENTKKLLKPSLIMQVLAASDDIDGLQKIYDISAAGMGENRAAIKLAVGLSCAGRTRDAMKILSAPNIIFSPSIISAEGRFMYETKNHTGLEALVRITKGKYGPAREKLIVDLLTLYRMKNLLEPALNIWTTLQEENFTPTAQMLELLNLICSSTQGTVVSLKNPSHAVKPVNETFKKTSSLLEKLKSQQEKAAVTGEIHSTEKPQSNVAGSLL